jgi:hypothetical protein
MKEKNKPSAWSKYPSRSQGYVAFQEHYTIMILKMNYMSFKNWNLIWFGGQYFLINEFAYQF